MGEIGDGVKTLSYIAIQRAIGNWQYSVIGLSYKFLENEQHVTTDVIKKGVIILEEKIDDAKKTSLSL